MKNAVSKWTFASVNWRKLITPSLDYLSRIQTKRNICLRPIQDTWTQSYSLSSYAGEIQLHVRAGFTKQCYFVCFPFFLRNVS